MRADGSDVRQLTDNKWEDASPGWMPEPKDRERAAEVRPPIVGLRNVSERLGAKPRVFRTRRWTS